MAEPAKGAEAPLGARRWREHHTVLAMIRIYCRGRHRRGVEDCAECRELREYAIRRLAGCVFAEGKPICQRCPVHCYKPEMRKRIVAVMRYAGPRMLLRHPWWAVRHLLDGFKAIPSVPKKKGR